MKNLKRQIEALPKDEAIAFGVRCARLAFSFYTGKNPEVLAQVLVALESRTEELPTTTAINKLLKEAKAIYAKTRKEADAANAYVAFTVYSALRSFRTRTPLADVQGALSSACKALKHLSPKSEQVIREDLNRCCAATDD